MSARPRSVLLIPAAVMTLGCAVPSSASEASGAGASSSGGDAMADATGADGGESEADGYQDAFTGPGDEGNPDIPDPFAPPSIDREFCETDWPLSADVSGTTPAGPFVARWAWFGWLTCNGEGLSPTLVLLDDPAALAEAVALQPSGDAIPYPSLEWYLFGACSPTEGWVGEGSVTFYLRGESQWHQEQGWVTIESSHRIFDALDPDDPPRMSGSIRIQDGDQWDVQGTFEAAYCGPLTYDLGCQ